ncbi:MAG: hypothetical protein AAB332_06175, partial [Planctomycetota bacterium]
MKIVQKYLLPTLCIGSLFCIWLSCLLVSYTGVCSREALAADDKESPVLLVKNEDDVVIYKKDIIIRSDELKTAPKKEVKKPKPNELDLMEVGAPVPSQKGGSKEFKVIEKPVVERPVEKKQESSSLEMADKYLKEGKKYEA